jgi:hypothetical protein
MPYTLRLFLDHRILLARRSELTPDDGLPEVRKDVATNGISLRIACGGDDNQEPKHGLTAKPKVFRRELKNVGRSVVVIDNGLHEFLSALLNTGGLRTSATDKLKRKSGG